MNHPLTEARKTLLLALPMVIGQVATQLMHATDLAMIGRVGVVPLAAATFGVTVFNLCWLIGIGPITAVSILVGEAHGAGDEVRARFVVRHGLIVSGLIGTLLSLLLMFVVSRTSIWHFGQPAEVIEEAWTYLLYLCATTVPLLLFITFKAYDEARGWPWLPLWFNAGSIVLNIALNWVFIYGHLGAPPMGLAGAGLATLLSRVIVLMFFWVYERRAPHIALRWTAQEWRKIDFKLCLELLWLGIPISLQIVFEVAAFNCALFMMGWLPHGTVALAAHAIALNYAALAFMVPLGVMFAASIRIGQARGSGNYKQARVIGWTTIGVAVIFMSVVAVVFSLGRHQLPYLFLNDSVGDAAPAVISLASTLLFIAAAFAVFDGIQVSAIGVLRGYRDVRLPTVISFIAYWLLCLPIGFGLAFRLDGTDAVPPLVARVIAFLPLPAGGAMGAPGVWAGLVVGLVVVAVAMLGRFVVISRREHSGGDPLSQSI